MLQVETVCAVERYEQTGAAVVATIFLGVFVVLIFGDAWLTYRALNKALLQDERQIELSNQLEEKKAYLRELNRSIKERRQAISKGLFAGS